MKAALFFTGYVILFLAGCVLLYFLVAFIFSIIPVNKEPQTQQDVSVYLLTNGVHTDLVVPVRNEIMDWNSYVNYKHTLGRDSSAEFVAFGWGDKGFYLETPTWADLKVSTAFKAATGLSSSAIHATFYKTMPENDACKRIMLSKEQYANLVKYIKKRFDTDESGLPILIETDATYGQDDAFYEATGSYNLFYTCNSWTNDGLKACGQKASLWTPFYKGIFYHYRDE